MKHTKTLWSATLSALLVLSSLTGCSAPAPGEPRSVDGGTEIIVPALWANGEKNIGGIELATVWVDSQRTSDQEPYEVNLQDVEAKGGGEMWQAATSSAAAIGSLFSGFDPDDIAYRFDITGPIDGPSAGGILTVGVLAALNEHTLDSKTTMTGTISPDGSIGPVGLIPQKLIAAKEAGYKKVLIPNIITTVSDPETGDVIDTQEFGTKQGIEVIYVGTLQKAYKEFTGEDLFPAFDSTTFPLSNFSSLVNAQQTSTTNLQQEVQQLLSSRPNAPEQVGNQLNLSLQASNNDEWDLAFGLAFDSLELLAAWDGTLAFQNNAQLNGIDAAREGLAQQLRPQIDRVSDLISSSASESLEMPPNQQLALPGALGWLTYARAVLESIEADLLDTTTSLEAIELENYAGLSQQVVWESEYLYPHVLNVLTSTPAYGGNSNKEVDKFLSGYSSFLVAAGDANLAYLRNVAGLSEEQEQTITVTDLVPVATQLSTQARDITVTLNPLEEEIEQSSIAMTYFVVTTSLVSSYQLIGSVDLWLNPEESFEANDSYIEQSVLQSQALTDNTAELLLEDNFNAGFAAWSAQWGSETYFELVAQGRTAAGATIALNELWYDNITVLSMNAFISTKKRGSE